MEAELEVNALMPVTEMKAKLEQQKNQIVTGAQALTVDSQEGLDRAVLYVQELIDPCLSQMEEQFRPRIKQAHDLHKGLLSDLNALKAPVERVKTELKVKILEYNRKLEAARKAEQERLAAEARKLAEEEALRRAVEAEEHGESDEAVEAILDDSGPMIPVLAATPVAKPAGLSIPSTWKAEVVSLTELARAVAAGKVPAHFIQANPSALNAEARSRRNLFNVPGCRVIEEKGVRIRG